VPAACARYLPGGRRGEGAGSLPLFGLGLEIQEPIPEPAPFREGQSEIGKLSEFGIGKGNVVLKTCGVNAQPSFVQDYLDREEYHRILSSLIEACVPYSEIEDLAREARLLGNEADWFQLLQGQALVALDGFRTRMSTHSGPGSQLEANLLSALQMRHANHVLSLDRTLSKWKAYDTGVAKTEVQLRSVFMGYAWVINETRAMDSILDLYPWGERTCDPIDAVELTRDTQRIDEDHQNAQRADVTHHEQPQRMPMSR
jgi:hypothetical protein